MSKNVVIFLVIFTACILSFRADTQDVTPIPDPLHQVAVASLSCLSENQTPGDAPPVFRKGEYKVKVLLRKSTSEEPNNLHLLVYRPLGGAILYENHVEQQRTRMLVDAGEWATFTGKGERLIPDELPGGLGTHQRIFKIMRKLQTEPVFIVTRSEVKAAQKVCDWTP
jgi:hypothetical protein